MWAFFATNICVVNIVVVHGVVVVNVVVCVVIRMVANRESSLIMQTLQFDSGDVKFAKLQPRTRGHFCLLSEELCQEKTISLFELREP